MTTQLKTTVSTSVHASQNTTMTAQNQSATNAHTQDTTMTRDVKPPPVHMHHRI